MAITGEVLGSMLVYRCQSYSILLNVGRAPEGREGYRRLVRMRGLSVWPSAINCEINGKSNSAAACT
jgi:hypothetical protein